MIKKLIGLLIMFAFFMAGQLPLIPAASVLPAYADDDHGDDDDDHGDDDDEDDEDEAESTRYLVTSVGTVDDVSWTVSAEVEAPDTSTFPAINCAIAGGSTSSHTIDSGTSSSPGTIIGDIYTGGALTLAGPSSGGVLAVTGNVISLSTVNTASSATVSGTTTQNSTTTGIFPTVDFDAYQAIATANNLYTVGNVTYASGQIPPAPAGGVIFVRGNITIRGTQSTTACIIATGSITISKSGSTYPRVTITKHGTYPVLMTQTGAITFSSTGNDDPNAYLRATGLIYSGNNFSVSTGNHGELTVTGSILARGTVNTGGMTASNSLTVTYAAGTPANFTGTTGSSATVKSYNS